MQDCCRFVARVNRSSPIGHVTAHVTIVVAIDSTNLPRDNCHVILILAGNGSILKLCELIGQIQPPRDFSQHCQ